ncbi:response regulator [Myxosarcina sp. GI1(2024)]
MTNKSILLIDFEFDVREVLRHCLSDFGGWNVILASSVREGLAKSTLEPPDAILLEVRFPIEAISLQLLREIKQSSWRYIPIVLITAKAKWLTAQQLREIGVVGAIATPFNPVSLPTEIAKLLGWQKA